MPPGRVNVLLGNLTPRGRRSRIQVDGTTPLEPERPPFEVPRSRSPVRGSAGLTTGGSGGTSTGTSAAAGAPQTASYSACRSARLGSSAASAARSAASASQTASSSTSSPPFPATEALQDVRPSPKQNPMPSPRRFPTSSPRRSPMPSPRRSPRPSRSGSRGSGLRSRRASPRPSPRPASPRPSPRRSPRPPGDGAPGGRVCDHVLDPGLGVEVLVAAGTRALDELVQRSVRVDGVRHGDRSLRVHRAGACRERVNVPVDRFVVCMSAPLTWSGVHSGCFARIRAAMPATAGAANDVPESLM